MKVLYDSLEAGQRKAFDKALLDNKVRAINAYSAELGVKMVVAKDFWHKMCVEHTMRE